MKSDSKVSDRGTNADFHREPVVLTEAPVGSPFPLKRIAIIGYGFVGRLYGDLLARRYAVTPIDPTYSYPHIDITADPPTIEHRTDEIGELLENANGCDVAVICLPTPSRKDGSADISAIDWWVERLSTPLIIIKSTVPPGSTNRWREKYGKRIVFSPEFAGESSYCVSEKYMHPNRLDSHPFVILGGPHTDAREVYDLLLPILGPEKEYVFCEDASEAELMKLCVNSWGAMKVTIFHEFALAAEKFGLSWPRLRELILKDPRIESPHTAYFGKPGWGGRCFPKDTEAFLFECSLFDIEMSMLKTAIERNKQWKSL